MSYRDDPDDIRERKIEKLIKERAMLCSYPIANQSKIKLIDSLLDSLQNETTDEEACESFETEFESYFSKNEQEQIEYSTEEPKLTFKEKILNSLGAFGVVFLFIIRVIVAILPFVMIGGNFFLTLILISINSFVPFASAVFWIWGLISAIKGVQDVWAIIYYIAFVLIWIPFFISTIVSMFSKE